MRKLANFFTGSLEKTIGLILFIALWELAPRAGWVNSTYLSPPSAVVSALIALLKSGDLLKHLLISLQRALVGMAVAVSFGMIFGLFIGYFKKIEGYLDALFQSFRQMSAFALFPVFILLFGVGELSKTIIIFWASLWPILLNTINGVKNVDTLLVQSAKSMGASQKFIFLRVILPAAAPDIFTGIRLGGSYCVMSLVAAEMIGATSGLGYLILYSQETFNIPDMYAGIVGLAIMGLGINYALKLIEKSFSSWKQGVAVGE
ncbi:MULTISPECIES: ABC transporter permease [Pelosinus]|uniref:ABC-type transporter, integral membrane subunit n=1 Tax=Pelosinus fermentans B4 TaxID=1149862 RepID=I9L5G2_9FIRM|nr:MULTISPECIES: ABC transporter permease [Pelosinus]EIW15604.1 ABC-type transporter, integral membrane subunit [Pelosinus fermentans B4]EIW26706.1 ABC-type transporter, integral membrane subunit [Pelosinus fermentans A11]OAM92349.1 ABC-type transporter, integral membrane subunit [Pelosinus fermentans DSM 17108]SDQ41724.1 NitT/TauT family transport system permease protein [Pelosinus fermentans]